jgi:hypothetical protein
MANSARDDLLEGMQGVREAANNQVLQTLSPVPANDLANRMAQLLRRGLYVVSFNLMEDFLKRRVKEHLYNLSSVSRLDFNQLPPALQKAAVIDAMKNGMQVARFNKSNDMQIVRDVARAVASTGNMANYLVHEYSLLHSGSNVAADDIAYTMGCLHMRDPWKQMQDLLDAVGNVGSPVRARFEACLLKRNAAAHQGANIEYTDLIEISGLGVAVCFAFDVIFSAGISRFADNVATQLNDPKVTVTPQIQLRFVTEKPRGWCRLDRNKRPLRYYPSLNRAVQQSLRNLSTMSVVVVVGSMGEIAGWHLADQRHPGH